MGSPLDGLLVVDVTSGVAGQLAGKVLARRGAEVSLVEPPGGPPARRAIAELYAAGTVADQPEQGAEVS
jgi:crotonobetainyl-CoA:carnitine CoA-transferase CaiB-like acyl-CoA transferase